MFSIYISSRVARRKTSSYSTPLCLDTSHTLTQNIWSFIYKYHNYAAAMHALYTHLLPSSRSFVITRAYDTHTSFDWSLLYFVWCIKMFKFLTVMYILPVFILLHVLWSIYYTHRCMFYLLLYVLSLQQRFKCYLTSNQSIVACHVIVQTHAESRTESVCWN